MGHLNGFLAQGVGYWSGSAYSMLGQQSSLELGYWRSKIFVFCFRAFLTIPAADRLICSFNTCLTSVVFVQCFIEFFILFTSN